jgi:hypothetical protein
MPSDRMGVACRVSGAGKNALSAVCDGSSETYYGLAET